MRTSHGRGKKGKSHNTCAEPVNLSLAADDHEDKIGRDINKMGK